MRHNRGMTNEAFRLSAAVPVLRIFDVAKAYEFYRDYLGFELDWEHRSGADFPPYALDVNDTFGNVLRFAQSDELRPTS